MPEFEITLKGKADGDSVREAFNGAVQTVRDAIDEGFSLEGGLTLDGVPYTIDEVPELTAEDTELEETDAPDDGSDEGAAPV